MSMAGSIMDEIFDLVDVVKRLFDIFKPFPIRRLEKIKGGIGIVLDDLLAGVYANLVLRLVLLSSAG